MRKRTAKAVASAAALTAALIAQPATASATGSTGWRSLKLPSLGTDNELTGIAAFSAKDAWAVGQRAGSATVLQWNGKKWTDRSALAPALEPTGIAGVSAKDFWIVGASTRGASGSAALHWNGAHWARYQFPSRSLAEDVQVNTIVTIAPNNAWAAGTDTGNGDAYIAHWTGKHWDPALTPAGDATVYAMAAAASNDIWAAGAAAGTGPLLDHWDGAKWRTAKLPPKLPGHWLTGVVALSRRNVWAVGGRTVLHYDGRTWRRVSAPKAAGLTPGAGLGRDGHGGLWWSFAANAKGHPGGFEHWNGRKWTLVKGPAFNGTGAQAVTITPVPGTAAVLAAGDYSTTGTNRQSLIEVDGPFPGA